MSDHRAYVDETFLDRGQPPERLERRARLCGVVTETGEPCRVWTLHPAGCLRHRRQPVLREDEL